jgi:hypothetical protein
VIIWYKYSDKKPSANIDYLTYTMTFYDVPAGFPPCRDYEYDLEIKYYQKGRGFEPEETEEGTKLVVYWASLDDINLPPLIEDGYEL